MRYEVKSVIFDGLESYLNSLPTEHQVISISRDLQFIDRYQVVVIITESTGA